MHTAKGEEQQPPMIGVASAAFQHLMVVLSHLSKRRWRAKPLTIKGLMFGLERALLVYVCLNRQAARKR